MSFFVHVPETMLQRKPKNVLEINIFHLDHLAERRIGATNVESLESNQKKGDMEPHQQIGK